MADPPETLLTTWLRGVPKTALASLQLATEDKLAEIAARRRRWSMVEPTHMAARAMLQLWEQQEAAGHLLACSSEFLAARPGLYAGGHEILVETLLWADRLHTGATIPEAQVTTLRGLLTQGLHIGSGTGSAMQSLRTQVYLSLDALFSLGRGTALQQALGDLRHLRLRLMAEAKTLASLAPTSTVLTLACRTALSDLRALLSKLGQAETAPEFSGAPPPWTDIHLLLRARLLDLGIDCAPRQLNELQLRGCPSHLVQALLASGRIDLNHYA